MMATTLDYAKLSQNVYDSATPLEEWTVLQEAPQELRNSGDTLRNSR